MCLLMRKTIIAALCRVSNEAENSVGSVTVAARHGFNCFQKKKSRRSVRARQGFQSSAKPSDQAFIMFLFQKATGGVA